MPDGSTQPAGTPVQRILWDGESAWTPPAGLNVVEDTGQALYAAPPPPPSAVLSTAAFLARLTLDEQGALWQAALASVINVGALPTIGVGLQAGLAAGQIDLTTVDTATWIAALVTAGVLTAARAATILAV
jgi:hypothetical protein